MRTLFLLAVLIFSVGTVSMAEEKAEVVTVFSVSGDVKIIPHGSNIGVACKQGMTIKPLDWIKTGADASVTIAFDNKADNAVTIEQNSIVVMKMDGYFKIQLLEGKIYAIIENVGKDDTFRTLTPSVVTESKTSAWGLTSDGMYTTVMVVDGEAYVCGINPDGTVKKQKYNIKSGFQRTTKRFDEPGELSTTPENVLGWFKDQVVQHHINKEIAKQIESKKTDEASKALAKTKEGGDTIVKQGVASGTRGKNVVVIDDQEVDIIDYIYRSRLRQPQREEKPKSEKAAETPAAVPAETK